jgi:hypothetical protein
MADAPTSTATTEVIELKLQTNFDGILKDALGRYRTFQTQIGGMSRQMASSLSNLHNQISIASRSMVTESVNAMQAEFNSARQTLNATATDLNSVAQLQQEAYRILEEGQRRFNRQLERNNIPEKVQEKALRAIQRTTVRALNELNQQINIKLGQAGASANRSIMQAAMGATQAIQHSADATMSRITNLARDIRRVLSSGGDITPQFNIMQGAEQQLQRVTAAVKQQQQRMLAAERNVQIARQALINQTNQALIEGNKRYLQAAERTYERVRAEAKRAMDKQIEMEKRLEQVRRESAQAAVQGIRQLTAALQTTSASRIIDQLKQLRAHAMRMGMDVSQSTTDMMKRMESAANGLAQKYTAALEKIRNAINNVRMMARQGIIPNEVAQRNIQQLQALGTQYRQLQQQATHAVRTIARETDRQMQRARKSTAGNLTDMLRNFRWKFAAMVYLVSRAIMYIKRIFFDVMDEIMSYRKDAFALAASMAGQFYNPLKQSFTQLYQYSRDLMQQLEMQAARTYLTLEDMVMLTKTFAQAGITPKASDIEKIAAIGTAIKVLTEGMANAGVQMRQELYAVIQGRQRATDQLAKFLQLQGVNIKQIMKEAQETGTSLVDSLYNELKQFSVLNKNLEKEYATQINMLEIIWKKLKRIAGEGVMESLAANVAAFNKSLMDIDTGNLTDRGEAAAITIYGVLESLRIIISELMTSLAGIFDILTEIGGIISDFILSLVQIFTNSKGVGENIKGWQLVLGGVMSILMFIANGLDALVTTVKSALIGIRGIFNILMGGAMAVIRVIGQLGQILEELAFGNFSKIGEIVEKATEDAVNKMKTGVADLARTGKPWEDMWTRVNQRIENIQRSIGSITQKLEGGTASRGLEGLLGNVRLPIQAIDELTKNLDKLKAEAQTGVDKYRELLRQATETYENMSKRTNRALNELKAAMDKAVAAGNEEAIKKIKLAMDKLALSVQRLGEWYRLMQQKLKNKIKVIEDRDLQKLQRFERQYLRLLQTLEKKPQSHLEKVAADIKKLEENIRELAKSNPVVAANLGLLMAALDAKKIADTNAALAKTAGEFNRIREQLVSKDQLTVYEQIKNELDKIRVSIQNNLNLSKEQKAVLLGLADAAQQRQSAEAKLTEYYENQRRLFTLMTQQADILGRSVRPSDQRAAEMLRITAQHKQAMMELNRELAEMTRRWGEGSEELANYHAYFVQAMANQKTLLKQHLEDVQRPFWKEMRELAQSWADSTADALADVILDFENAAETLKNLFEGIVRDFLSAFIRNMLTDNLLDALGGGGSGGPWGGIADWLGGSGSSGPDSGDVADTAGDVAGDLAGDAGQTAALTANTTALTAASTAITALTTALTAVTTAMTASSTAITAQTALIAPLTASLTALTAAVTANTAALAANSASNVVGMASGGMITEPIVGQGLRTGTSYMLGESGPELVTPMSQADGLGGSRSETNVMLNINAIDTRSGVDFLMKHRDTIENQLAGSITSNRVGRRAVRGAR